MTNNEQRTFYDADVDGALVRQRRIAVLGFGSQGKAQAENLRDSGCEVRVGLRQGSSSRPRAEAEGFPVGSVSEVSAWGDVICLLLPDHVHRDVFQTDIRPHLAAGNCLLVAHGFSLTFGLIAPPDDVDVTLVAPVGPGAMLRRMYLRDFGIPAVVAVGQDATGRAQALALSYAHALGCTRVGVQLTTIQEETETDLFGEQAVLCGGLTALIKAGFDTLVEAGYQPELAYFECLHQIKLIVDLIYENGLSGMHAAISETAELGDYLTGPRVIDSRVRATMREVLEDIRNGTFARRFLEEAAAGSPTLTTERARERASLVEQVGAQLRARMGGLAVSDDA